MVKDKQTGVEWAIDSWFTDNGVPPLVMTVDAWYKYRRGAGATNL